MTLAALLAALGLTSSPEIETSIGEYVTAQTVQLKTNRDQLLKDVRKLKDDLKAFEGLDAGELAEAIAELDIDMADVADKLRAAKNADPKNADVAKQIADAVAAAEAKMQRKIVTAEKKAGEAETALQAANKARVDEHISRELTQQIAEQKGNVDLLSPMLRGRVKGEIGEDGKVALTVLAANGEEMQAAGGQVATVRTLVETIKAEEKFGAAFEAEGGGSGAAGDKKRVNPTAGKNPYMKGTPHYSLTEQAALREKNPALAKQLKEAAERASASG